MHWAVNDEMRRIFKIFILKFNLYYEFTDKFKIYFSWAVNGEIKIIASEFCNKFLISINFKNTNP